MSKKTLTYKSALKELEEIVNKIENESPDVDELIGMVKRAIELMSFCKTKLRTTEEELKKNLGEI
ncbi:exodeoxyribonuclease VII small subunit [Bacteroidota bacterium]